MGTAIAVRTDYASETLRRLAARVKKAAQARRLLAIAAVLDGDARAEAAKIGGMDRQTLRDWGIRVNEQRPDGPGTKTSPGGPSKLTKEHKAFLVRIVEAGPMPAIHGPRPAQPVDLSVRCRLSRTRHWGGLGAAGLQPRGHAAPSRRDRAHRWRRCPRHPALRPRWLAYQQGTEGTAQHLVAAAAGTRPRAQPPGKYLAVHAPELTLKSCLQILLSPQ